jgi:hypothetical protein
VNIVSTIDEAAASADRRQEIRSKRADRKTADRLWAYSDAVFAVIVTIMVCNSNRRTRLTSQRCSAQR